MCKLLLVVHWSDKSEAVPIGEVVAYTLPDLVLFEYVLADAKDWLQAVFHVIFGTRELFRDVMVEVSKAPVKVWEGAMAPLICLLLTKIFH